MMHLAEYRTRPALLADWLPWAGLVAPGVVLNKDGSFQRTARFRGPDLDTAPQGDLIPTAARLNNGLRRPGSRYRNVPARCVDASRETARPTRRPPSTTTATENSTMKALLTVAACTLLLAACSKPASTESVESLMANPERLKDVRAQCKADHAKAGDALCTMAAEATRRRFMGSGTPYTPAPPATPRSAPKD